MNDKAYLLRKVCTSVCTYITLHKIVFRVPKTTRTARTLYEIKGVMWEGVQLCGKTLEKRNQVKNYLS